MCLEFFVLRQQPHGLGRAVTSRWAVKSFGSKTCRTCIGHKNTHQKLSAKVRRCILAEGSLSATCAASRTAGTIVFIGGFLNVIKMLVSSCHEAIMSICVLMVCLSNYDIHATGNLLMIMVALFSHADSSKPLKRQCQHQNNS